MLWPLGALCVLIAALRDILCVAGDDFHVVVCVCVCARSTVQSSAEYIPDTDIDQENLSHLTFIGWLFTIIFSAFSYCVLAMYCHDFHTP